MWIIVPNRQGKVWLVEAKRVPTSTEYWDVYINEEWFGSYTLRAIYSQIRVYRS